MAEAIRDGERIQQEDMTLRVVAGMLTAVVSDLEGHGFELEFQPEG